MGFKLALMLSLVVASGCGKSVKHSSEEKQLSSVQAHLDSKNFESAIPVLEAMRLINPHNQVINAKLLHAYAGAGSFETVKVISIWKEIEAELKIIKKEQKDKLDKSTKIGLDAFIEDMDNVLKPIPQLSALQKRRLDQAISLYQELGLEVETAGKYNNFKWGSLHLYRLAITIKDIVSESKRIESQSGKADLKAIEQMMMPKLKILGLDAFMAYKLYGNSFDRVRKITESIDKLIAKTVGDKEFKLRVSTIARSEGEFYRSLIKDNKEAASVLIRKLSDMYHANGYKERLAALGKALPTAEELKESQKRIEALVTVLIDTFTTKHPEIEAKLKAIFTEELKQDFILAAKESIKLKNTLPIKELLNSKKPEIEVLNSYYLLLKGEVDASNLGDNIKIELEALKKKVDLELLKSELKAIEISLKADAQTIELGLEAMANKNKEKLIARQEYLNKEIKWLEKYLEDLADGVRQSTEGENKDQKEMDKISSDVIKFVES